MRQQIHSIVGPEDARKFKEGLGQWEWYEGEPWVGVFIQPHGAGLFAVTIEKCELDEDSKAWLFRGKPITFGPDETVLEKWMDEAYVREHMGTEEQP